MLYKDEGMTTGTLENITGTTGNSYKRQTNVANMDGELGNMSCRKIERKEKNEQRIKKKTEHKRLTTNELFQS